MILQDIWTDSNCILSMQALFRFYSLKHHMGLDELQQKDYLRKLFNTKFKFQNQLDNLIEYMYKKEHPINKNWFFEGA